MDTYENLVEYASGAGIMVLEEGHMTASIRMGDVCAVFMNNGEYPSPARLTEALAHELGHCEKGAFYSEDSPRVNVRKCERIADYWSVRALLPLKRLNELIEGGAMEIHELAEASGRSEGFVLKAVELYRSKGLL